MRIGVLTTSPFANRPNSVMTGAAELLRDWGATVRAISPDDELTGVDSVRVDCDLYLLKSPTPLALSVAGALHASGANLLNPYPVAAACRDKVVATRILHAAGVPVPATYVAGDPARLVPVLKSGPLVVKPYRGSGGDGVRVVRESAELDGDGGHAGAGSPDGLLFAQRYHQPDGPDSKLYCIGGQLFGVRRQWPARTYEEKLGEPFVPDYELREIALRCGRALGMDLYGVDVITSDGRPYVVDVSSFPGFKGVPDAALRLADYIYATVRRVMEADR
jgi:ribosomal protein S6--L-glutamate ligase